jgi:hypothetical protein
MSIAGIAKEVTTITISAWFFGDQLTPLNITGVSITILGRYFLPLYQSARFSAIRSSQVSCYSHIINTGNLLRVRSPWTPMEGPCRLRTTYQDG